MKKSTQRLKQVREYEDIGGVQYVKSARSRRINIRVRPFDGIRVTLPLRISFKQAEDFLRKNIEWVIKITEKTRDVEKDSVIQSAAEINTRSHRLLLIPSKADSPRFKIANSKIRVTYPAQKDVRDPDVQETIRRGLIEAYRKEAKSYLPPRVAGLARVHGFKYGRVFIKNHRSRWGSCSEKNNINLSLHLMRLPDDLIDYVILHELVHTEIKNHSPKFWQRLQEVCPDAKIFRKRLRAMEKGLPRIH